MFSICANVTINFSEVKFKVQDQSHRTKNLSFAIARLWFKNLLRAAEKSGTACFFARFII